MIILLLRQSEFSKQSNSATTQEDKLDIKGSCHSSSRSGTRVWVNMHDYLFVVQLYVLAQLQKNMYKSNFTENKEETTYYMVMLMQETFKANM